MNTTDLIALMRATPAIEDLVGSNIYNARVPALDPATGSVDAPYIWVQQRGLMTLDLNAPPQGSQPMGKLFDVECVAETADESEQIRDAVYSLHGYRGLLGDGFADGLFVSDQDDDYLPRNPAGDAGVFVGSLVLQIIGE